MAAFLRKRRNHIPDISATDEEQRQAPPPRAWRGVVVREHLGGLSDRM